MSTNLIIHQVVHVRVLAPVVKDSARWQDIEILDSKGNITVVGMFLAESAVALDPTPRNRVDDVPRQPALIPE